jgi:hypothetical protein
LSRRLRTTSPRSSSSGGSNPSIAIRSAPDHPGPVPVYGDLWDYRVYSSPVFTENVAGEGIQFRANAFNAPGNFFVDKLQVWRVNQFNGGLGLNAGFYSSNCTDLSTAEVVNGTDLGSGNSMCGMTFVVPEGHATEVSSGTTNILADAKCMSEGGNTVKNSFVAYLHCWVKI